MSEYSLKFKDLEEGKVYENWRSVPSGVANTKYKIVNGLLWTIKDKNYSMHNQLTINDMRFREIIQVSEDVKNVLRKVHHKYKYIVIDRNNDVYLCVDKPFKGSWYWQDGKHYFRISNYFDLDFSFLSWEDEEPTRISDLV